ncbi:prepilin-type N-terminal cleavage/methylation domain-containing protein, partial [uncultured Campylobacter sp.]
MKKGFTLIELVFVIVVLGIISMFGADLYTKIYKSYVH